MDISMTVVAPPSVLVVDDDQVIRETFSTFLVDSDYVVSVAHDAVSAIEMYDSIHPDVVLLDIRMPGEINGIDVLKYIKKKDAKVPVIMISGMANMDDAVDALRHGAWDYLKKPVMDLDILKHVVDRAYDKRRLEKENLRHVEQITAANQKLQAAVQEANLAKRQAEKANLAKSQFVKKMSNELRIPAMGIESMIDILLESPLSEEQHHYARVIQSSIMSLSSSLTELFDYSRIETQTLNLERVNFNLEGIIADVVANVQFRNKSTGVSFEQKIQPGLNPFLQGDPWRLGQLIRILLENAFKFTKSGTVALMVTLEDTIDTDLVLKFTVADTGIGISPEGLTSLFEAFTQADDFAGAYSGIGLGLALAKQISSMMDGKIGVNSSVGKGSTFWFTARLGKQPPEQELDDTDIGRVVSSLSSSPSGVLNILLADRNNDAQLVGTAFLKRLGCSFKTAMTSTQTLEFLEEENFDVLLLDLDIGDMGGLETAGVIRSPISAVRDHHIPIVGISSICDSSIKTKCQRVGIHSCIPKPYSFTQLLGALEKSLEKTA
ncbi:MAG: response regulator [Deltaproteobacteria bacterium]|nr:response regulator [Deltaproteobacteria bacterium]